MLHVAVFWVTLLCNKLFSRVVRETLSCAVISRLIGNHGARAEK